MKCPTCIWHAQPWLREPATCANPDSAKYLTQPDEEEGCEEGEVSTDAESQAKGETSADDHA